MKKDGILKAIGIVFLIYVVASWLIPTGAYSNGTFTTDATAPIGIFDLIRYPIINLTSSVFVLTAVVMLFIGGLYGVLNKTGVYSKFVNNIAKKYENKKQVFLVISILLFSILASLTALVIPLFAMVPLFVAVILLLGYDKMTAFISTVGAILVGNMVSTYGFNINGYLSYFYQTDIHASIWFRLLLLIVIVILLILFTLKIVAKEVNKKSKKEDKLEIPLYEESKTKKKSTAMIIILSLMMIISLIGMFNWVNGFGIKFFDDIYSSVTEFEIGGYPLFKNLLGSISAIGYWSNYEFALMLIITSFVIGKIYGLTLKEIVPAFIEGCKKMIPVAIYVIFANIVFLLMNSSSTGSTFYATISNWLFNLTDNLNIFTAGASALIGGLLYNDFPYMINAVYSQVSTLTENLNLIALVQQTMHGLVALIAPTSIILVAGLKYLDISYKEWLKNIWKFLIIAFVIILIVLIVMALI
ncbi:MAG: hypothetical protein PHN42_02390 [Bacilli bacterium]|nr:hypothetical protein [Bacilli bacterium]